MTYLVMDAGTGTANVITIGHCDMFAHRNIFVNEAREAEQPDVGGDGALVHVDAAAGDLSGHRLRVGSHGNWWEVAREHDDG